MKKVLSIVLSIAMVLCMMPAMAFAGTASAAQANAAYSDTEGLACEGAVNVLSALGVVDGYTDGTYKPEQTVTRAEMAKLIVTALGVDKYATATTSKFTDMGAASWAIPYVEYASNLNIVNGYGYGLFGPNDTVTYEQAVTMVVRALGYTDACNEMNGSWPAIYVQKATALGLFENVQNGGAVGANRGDVAIILYNALDCAEVYADNEGATNQKTGAPIYDASGNVTGYKSVTMMDTLNKNGKSAYDVIDSTMVNDAVINISQYLGAAAKVTTNKDGKVVAVGDIKSTFVTGTIKSDGKIEIDGTKYTIDTDAASSINATTGGSTTATSVPNFVNTDKVGTLTVANIQSMADKKISMAAEISGTTVKKIYSVIQWQVKNAAKVEDTDLAQITANKKLLSYSFKKDDSGNIDNDSFTLLGADSLDKIAEDNVVYVYTNLNNEIVRVTVGTNVISGEITKVTTKPEYTIDGNAYQVSSAPGADSVIGVAGDTIDAWLDYDGKIYKAEESEVSTGNFAILTAIDYSKAATTSALNIGISDSVVASAAKVQLMTADGAKVYTVNPTKYNKSVDNGNSSEWKDTDLVVGDVVKFSTNDSGEITKLVVAGALSTNSKYETIKISNKKILPASTVDAKITKAGYLDGHSISESAFIVAAPADGTTALKWTDTDDCNVVSKSSVVDNTVTAGCYVFDKDKKTIVAMTLNSDVTSDSVYGIVSSKFSIKDATGVDFWAEGEKTANVEVDDGSNTIVTLKDTNWSSQFGLYEIKATANGKYKFVNVDSANYTLKHVGNGSTTGAAVKVSNNEATINTETIGIASNVQVYIYDKSDDAVTVGSKADLYNLDNTGVAVYVNNKSTKDNYGLIEYVVIKRA